ncbi:uncharacterized protein BO80DRAFT_39915 [Aspergillus ibericus CBS 121593]|uniref:Uncharacterized protein n=1 Tax=Aspergillus ibericus CBS 121593 TaxID=1448316 RepID=A0A395H392_9EURO|nr:hypothetical protein BO80DRAFT_39915 [Aspergillus ibericus CBS 121593]RAL02113.1 hypothetical protein BO80DRAFT_39915 [Aspergillus ibericus CBS 121593]
MCCNPVPPSSPNCSIENSDWPAGLLCPRLPEEGFTRNHVERANPPSSKREKGTIGGWLAVVSLGSGLPSGSQVHDPQSNEQMLFLSCRSRLLEWELRCAMEGACSSRRSSARKVESPPSFVSDSIRLAADPFGPSGLSRARLDCAFVAGQAYFQTGGHGWLLMASVQKHGKEVHGLPPLARPIHDGSLLRPHCHCTATLFSSSPGQFRIFPRRLLPPTVTCMRNATYQIPREVL